MKVPITWLKEFVDFDLSPEQIAVKLTMGGLEVEGIEESGIGPVLDVYVTPNRGDCLSMLGVAREVSALLGIPLKQHAAFAAAPGGPVSDLCSVTIQAPDLCPRYAARVVEGVKVGPSPYWLSSKLEAAGQRSVNNVVDITNLVMLEMGQPLHAFDLDKLGGHSIVVRRANAGESITTLDGETRELTPSMLVIADNAAPVGVAGIMGGAESEVSDATTRILLESAHFAPLTVRRTSLALALRTEASYRFERVVDPGGVTAAIDRCAELLEKLGVPAVEGVIDVYMAPAPARKITLRVAKARDLLGMDLNAETCSDCLAALGFGVDASDETLAVTVPTYRADIAIEEDLIEEVGRIHGYENIPETLPQGVTTRGGDSELGLFLSEIRHILSECGMREVVTHSLTAPSFFDSPADAERRVSVRNALSANVSGLRRSLLPTLVDTAQNNAARGQQNLALFEVGRVWQNEVVDGEPTAVEYLSVAGLLTGSLLPAGWRSKTTASDYYTMKGILDRFLDKLCISGYTLRSAADRNEPIPQLHPGRSATMSLGGGRPDGVIGELHPGLASDLDLRNRIYLFEISLNALLRAAPIGPRRYKTISRQQAIQRDIAPRVAEGVTYAAVSSAIAAASVPILHEYRLTDLYRGTPLPPDTKSLTLSLTFAFSPPTPAEDRAVTEQEVNDALAQIRAELEVRCGATFAG